VEDRGGGIGANCKRYVGWVKHCVSIVFVGSS